MSLFNLEDLVEDIGIPGVLIGVGAVVLAPIFGPAWRKQANLLPKLRLKVALSSMKRAKLSWRKLAKPLVI